MDKLVKWSENTKIKIIIVIIMDRNGWLLTSLEIDGLQMNRLLKTTWPMTNHGILVLKTGNLIILKEKIITIPGKQKSRRYWFNGRIQIPLKILFQILQTLLILSQRVVYKNTKRKKIKLTRKIWQSNVKTWKTIKKLL